MAAGRIKGITIEIGGDTTKLVSALAKVDNAISKTQSNLRDINKALKFDPSSTALLKDKQVELAHAIDETKQKLKTEKEAYEQLAHADKTPENVEKMRQLKTQIDLDTAALKDFERQARESASVLGTQMQIAGEKISQVGEKIKGVGDKLVGLGRTMTTHVTMPIASGFGAVIKTTADFDAQMSKVQAISGSTAEQMEVLETKARKMGETTKFSATESGQAFEYMAMAGWKNEEMLEGIEGIMNLAAASGEELATTSDIVTDALTALGLSAKDSGRFADILAAAATNANTNVAKMGESFKYAAAPAGLLGYSAEDVAIALGLMANAGIKADMAGTSLRNMFNRMAKPTKESAEAMERLGISISDKVTGRMYTLREIMDQLRAGFANINMPLDEYNKQLDDLDAQLEAGEITQKNYESSLEELNKQAFGAAGAEKARAAAMLGGTRAMSGLAAIASATEEDYRQLTEAIDNSSNSFARLADGSVVPLNEALKSGQEIMEEFSGAAEAMANVMLDNFSGDLTILKSQLQELAISLGKLLMPYLRELVTKLQNVVTWLSGLDDQQKRQIMKIAALVAAIGPLLMIVGNLTRAIGSIIDFGGILTTGIGKLLTFISGGGGLVPAIQGLVSHGATLMGGIKTLIAGITAISAPVLAVVAVVGALTAAFIYFYQTNDEFRDRVNAAIESVKEIFTAFVEKIKELLAVLMETIGPVVQSIMEYLGAVWELFRTILDLIGNALVSWINKHQVQINAFLSTMKLIIQVAMDFISNHIKTKLEAIKIIFTTILGVITNLVKAFTAMLKGDWKTAFDYIKTAAQTALDGVVSYFKSMASNTKDLFKNLISDFKKWGEEMVENLVSGITSKIGKVSSAMSSLTSKIRSYIHFTEPDIGPLSDFHTYMPDMIKTLVSGINDGIPQVQQAMGNLTNAMVPSLSDSVAGKSMTNNNNVNITVYGAQGQDVYELADIIQDRINAEVYSKGAVFS